MLDVDTNMDAMSNTLLHMRNQLTDSHREINLLKEENVRLKSLYGTDTSMTINASDSTPNGTNHRDQSNIPTKTKRSHLLIRTTPTIDVTPSAISSLNQMMDVDSISLNSTNNDNNQHTPLENGINVI
jgi:hypothetical protein